MNAFTKAPLFGYGWGDKVSSDCHDLVFRLLSGTGLFGFAGFLALVSSIYWASLRHTQLIKQGALGYGPDGGLSQRANEALAMVQALRVALTIAIALDVVTGLSFVAGPLWLVMGLMAGASHALSPEQSRYPAGMGIEGLRA
jgi:O-antigen ligase